MGTWGAGNLDNDSALDELGERIGDLICKLWKRAHSKTSRQGDQYDYTTLFVEFEILFALDDRKLLRERLKGLPTPAAVDELKADFIRAWDDNIDALEPTPEHKRTRRQAILRTFNRFKRICSRNQDL